MSIFEYLFGFEDVVIGVLELFVGYIMWVGAVL